MRRLGVCRGEDRVDAGDGDHRGRRQRVRCGSAPTWSSTKCAATGAGSPRSRSGPSASWSASCVHGNRVTRRLRRGGFLQWVWLPLLLGIGFAGVGIALDLAHRRPADARSSASPPAPSSASVWAAGPRPSTAPSCRSAPLVVWTAGGVAVGRRSRTLLRKKNPVTGALVGGAIGSVIGGWGEAKLGDGLGRRGDRRDAAVPAVAVGARLGLTTNPDYQARTRIDTPVARRHLPGSRRCCSSSSRWSSRRSAPSTSRCSTPSPTSSSSSTTTSTRSRTRPAGMPANWTNMFTSRLFFIGHRPARASPSLVGIDRQAAHGPSGRDRQPDGGPAAGRRPARRVRRLHQLPRHDRQQPLVGRHRRVLLDRAGPRRRRAGRRRQEREARQVADLHAAGHLARRRVGHLAVHVRAARRHHRADRVDERAVGRARAGSARAAASRRSSSASSSALVLAGLLVLVAVGRASSGDWGQAGGARRRRCCSSAGSSCATRHHR